MKDDNKPVGLPACKRKIGRKKTVLSSFSMEAKTALIDQNKDQGKSNYHSRMEERGNSACISQP